MTMRPSLKEPDYGIAILPPLNHWANFIEFERELHENNLRFLAQIYNTEEEERLLSMDD